MRIFVIACIVLFTMAGTAFSETKEPPKKLSVDLGGGVKMEMVLVPSGEFKMGSGESAEETAAFFDKNYNLSSSMAVFYKDEHPQHRVRITKPFYLGTYHVTRGQFRQFVKDSGYKTDAEKGEKPGAGDGTPRDGPPRGTPRRRATASSTRSILGGTRVSSRPTSTRWST